VKKMLRRVGSAALRVAKRFLTNEPQNIYERTVFDAVRHMAYNFGKAVVT
jgi:hypothetical protein